MENNIKSIFFAQYWGQEVNHYRISKLSARKIESVKGTTFGYLKLKPMSQISDEDALKAVDLLGKSNNSSEESRIFQFKKLFESPNFWVNQTNIPLVKMLKVFDFLRSKGYALPFMDYSVEQLIEMGWVKLN